MFKIKLMMILLTSTTILTVILAALGQKKMEQSLNGATGWVNTQPVSLSELHGKVVLIDFWTYTCINWRRTLPYLQEWKSKYKDKGLIIIGVHTPEFSFEYKKENVEAAIKDMKIDYPIAMDNNYEIWNSFQNNYWPALYLVDAKGQIRFQHFGEGNYRETEIKIQHLLKENSAKNISKETAALQPDGFEAMADLTNLQSPENYTGYSRTEGFASPENMAPDNPVLYSATQQLELNQWALFGEWIAGKEKVSLSKKEGKIIYRFHARDLNLIMGPTTPGKVVKFQILMDGKQPGISHGLDIDSSGYGRITEPRMYQLIRQPGCIIDRVFEIKFFDPEAEVFDFTFG